MLEQCLCVLPAGRQPVAQARDRHGPLLLAERHHLSPRPLHGSRVVVDARLRPHDLAPCHQAVQRRTRLRRRHARPAGKCHDRLGLHAIALQRLKQLLLERVGRSAWAPART